MSRTAIFFFGLAALQVLLPTKVYAGVGISTTVTTGSDDYLANYTAVRLGLTKKLDLNCSYSYSDSDLNTDSTQVYHTGVNIRMTNSFSARGNIFLTPKVGSYQADGFGLGTTMISHGWLDEKSSRSTNFQTIIDLDYSLINHVYDVHTEGFTVYYQTRRGGSRQATVAAKNTSETIKQANWTLGVTEIFYADTSLYLGYSDYTYSPDIEEDIVLYDAGARQSNARIFNLFPGLGGFPKFSYEVLISRNFLSRWTVSAGYLHAAVLQFTLNENSTPSDGTLNSIMDDFYEVSGVSADSYTLGLDYYLNDWIILNTSYNLYREVYKDTSSYYSLGLTLAF
ncbi:MAG: hypothetical protein PHD29_05060 [bacterium]|nr:hypothetical protein [bacterium]MDD5353728.1 hypothetical protein [bacterium]MDD5755890.1 hypothetical protein [bacterium]